jgi:DNA-directed RNA polymerase specialized sigma24 family protein
MNRRRGDSHRAVRSTAVRKDCGPQDEMRALAHQVAGWPTTQRRVFTLRKVYGLRPGDIARRLGLTELEVEKQLIQAALACAAGCVEAPAAPEQFAEPPAPKVDL